MVTPDFPQDLAEVLRHLESCYPSEGCGLLLQGPEGWRFRAMENAYDRYHAKDPARFPRTSRTAYFFEPKEWLTVSEQADQARERVACIVHSHADVGAYFSKEDRDMAAPDGLVLMPGVAYWVVAVDAGKATAAKLFWWNGSDFDEASTPIPQDVHKSSPSL